MDSDLSFEDLHSLCRTCTASGVHSSIIGKDEAKNILNLTGIVINPDDNNFPKRICDQCMKLLRYYSEFRLQVIKNDTFLTEIVRKSQTLIQKCKQANANQIEMVVFSEDCSQNFEENAVEIYAVDDYNDGMDGVIEERNAVKQKKTKRSETTRPSKTPRNVIEVDPAKITTLLLSKEEQRRRQMALADRLEYKNMPFRCERCYKGFNYERKLNSHTEKYHKTGSRYECDVCTRTMSNAPSLALHLKTHELLYECNICKATFVEKVRALSHYQNIHEGISREYPCGRCERVFYNRSTLNGHLRNHHPVKERPKCEQCGKSFVSTDSLDDHMLIHSGEKNYSCGVCGVRFRLRQSARRHARHAHCAGDARARTVACPCGAEFRSRAAYTHHVNTAKPHVTDAVRAKNTCGLCGRQFATRYALAKHSRTHAPKPLGEARRSRPKQPVEPRIRYVCHVCGRGFAARRTLENHILTHTGARPVACPRCPARFAQRATLNAHTRSRHAM